MKVCLTCFSAFLPLLASAQSLESLELHSSGDILFPSIQPLTQFKFYDDLNSHNENQGSIQPSMTIAETAEGDLITLQPNTAELVNVSKNLKRLLDLFPGETVKLFRDPQSLTMSLSTEIPLFVYHDISGSMFTTGTSGHPGGIPENLIEQIVKATQCFLEVGPGKNKCNSGILVEQESVFHFYPFYPDVYLDLNNKNGTFVSDGYAEETGDPETGDRSYAEAAKRGQNSDKDSSDPSKNDKKTKDEPFRKQDDPAGDGNLPPNDPPTPIDSLDTVNTDETDEQTSEYSFILNTAVDPDGDGHDPSSSTTVTSRSPDDDDDFNFLVKKPGSDRRQNPKKVWTKEPSHKTTESKPKPDSTQKNKSDQPGKKLKDGLTPGERDHILKIRAKN